MPSPWSSATVEFVGGPADGRIMEVPTKHMGRPPHSIFLPVAEPLSVRFMEDRDPTYLELNQARYESAGVMSDDRHTWLYSYRGMQ